MIEQNLKHPNYNNEFLSADDDVFRPEFKRDSRGRYFMQLPGYGKWMVGNEPGSKIISQGSEDEGGGPGTDPGSIRTGSLHVDTVISIGDNIYLDGGTGCIYVGDYQKRVGPSMSICGDGMRGYVGTDTVFAFFLEKDGDFGVGDVFIGDYGSDNYVLWDDSEGYLYIKGKIYATSGEIGGWEIGACLKQEYIISSPSKTKIELCAGNPGHVQAAYSPSGSFSLPGDIYMVQITQGSTADSGGVPIPRMDIYRNGKKRMMLNSDGLYFFESNGTTIATSILSGATNEENFSNVDISGGTIDGPIALPNAQTIADVTAHVIDIGNAHGAHLSDITDAQGYMDRMNLSIDDLPEATYIGHIWTHVMKATSPGTSGVIVYNSGIKGYDASNNLRFFLNASTGDFYFGDHPTGNYISWTTSGGTLAVKGEIRALTGYIGGSTTGWKIASNVMQAYTGATKVIELSVTGPHIQCLKDSSNYVQMTPASSDPRFDVFVSGSRRIRLNSTGLTFYTSAGAVTSFIGIGTGVDDATFGGGVVRCFNNGVRVSWGQPFSATDNTGSNYFQMYVDTSSGSFGYENILNLSASNSLKISTNSSSTSGKAIARFYGVGVGANGQTGGPYVLDLFGPLRLFNYPPAGGPYGSHPGNSIGAIYYSNGSYVAEGVWVRMSAGWTQLGGGGGGTVTQVNTSGAITGGPITTTGTISHSTSSGYKHIPSGGGTYQTLRNSASGTASWTSNLYCGSLSTYYFARNAGTGDLDFVIPSSKDYHFTRGGTSVAVIDNNLWILAQITAGGTIKNDAGDFICSTGNLQLKKNGAIVAIDDAGGITRYLTVQWNATLSKYILSN